MKKQDRVPRFNEVICYYNPGNFQSALYVQKDSTKRRGRVVINRNRRYRMKRGLGKLIKLQPPNNPKLVIVEDKIQLEKVTVAATELGLVTIEMEPIR